VKKIIVMMMVLVIALTSMAYGDKFSEYDEVTLTDALDMTSDSYKTVSIRIAGEDIISDVPAIIYPGDRVLIPISFVTDKIGADIKWDGGDNPVVINYLSKEIHLYFNSKTAYVDGRPYTLPSDVPAKLMSFEGNWRTMVPVRFVSEQLGYDIAWEAETRTVSINRPRQDITGVRYDTSGVYPELRFKVTGQVDLTSVSVDGNSVGSTDALILNFHNTDLNLTQDLPYGRVIINDMVEKIYDISFESKDSDPVEVKAVIDMGYYRHGEVSYDVANQEMVVQLINAVNYVDVETINQATAVVIDTAELPAFNRTYDPKTNSLIIDIIHSKLTEADSVLDVNQGGILKVTSEQNDHSTEYGTGTRYSRVTVQLDDHLSESNVYVEGLGSKVYVYVQEALFGTYGYSRDLESDSGMFNLNLLSAYNYNIAFNEDLNRISFTIPKTHARLTPGSEKKDDGVVDTIVVADNGNTGNYDIQIYLSEGTTYKVTSPVDTILQIGFTSEILKNSEFKDKLIVIDAGHGGHDPGASYDNLLEKDLNLTTSLLLKKKLENIGFKVYMTRERDKFIQLRDRAAIANQLNADLFISVHTNAAASTKAYGIETLYDPDNTRNNYAFASAIQKGMIDATGNYSRGIVPRPELAVIRLTEMDAVLVEIGFVSNPMDYLKLSSEAYLDSVAEGIMNGVVEYME